MTKEDSENQDTWEETSRSEESSQLDLKIDYVSRQSQKKMKDPEKCDLILNQIRNNRILIFEGGLDPKTEVRLIASAMEEIDHEFFLGLEIYSPGNKKSSSIFQRESRVTIITPANCDVRVRSI
ncbi:MAG: OapB/ArvB family protein [Candidatus Hodarchaeales archaeon]|jgi:hypothetical protein